MIPWACAASSASAIWIPISRTWPTASAFPPIRCLRVQPSRDCMAMKESPRSSPISYTVKMGILGFVHHAHSAPAELLHDAVMGNGLSDERLGLRHLVVILGREPEG